jgi:hypothetical protein
MAAVTYGHQVYLRQLDMSECIRLDDAGLQLVASYCPALVKLYVRRCPLITDRGVQYVAAYCVSLRERCRMPPRDRLRSRRTGGEAWFVAKVHQRR